MTYYSHLGPYRRNISRWLRSRVGNLIAPLTISECESLVEWATDINGSVSVDNATFNSGTGSLKLIRDVNTLNTYSVDMTYVADLSIYKTITFNFYVVDNRFLSTIVIKFFTTVAKADTDCLFYSIPVASVINGWNSFSELCTAFTQAGVGTWANIEAIRFEINLTE